MGIIDDYLESSDTSAAPTSAPMKSSGLIDQYLSNSEPAPKRVYITKPPISGFDAATSEQLNARPETVGKSNDTQAMPSVGKNILDDFIAGLTKTGQGVGETLSNKPATGLGTIASGAIDTLTSPITGAGKTLEQYTGNKDFADKAELAASLAVPIAPLARAASKANPTNKALSMLVEHIGEKELPSVVKELKADPSLAPADLSPRVRMSTQKLLANVEGPHQNYIEGAAEARKAAAAGDLEQHMNANLGAVVDPVKKLEELKQNIRDIGTKEITPAIAGSKPVDLSGTIAHIDDILSPGVNSKISHDTTIADPKLEESLRSIRKYLTDDKSLRTDPEQLNRLQSAFRKKAELTAKTDAYLAGAISKIRDSIVDAIDKASGGKYKPALANYRDEYQIQDAFEYGHDAIMKNGKNLSDRPEFFEQKVGSIKPEELQAAKEGARIAYDTQMFGFKHAARRGTDIGDVEFNTRRMEALFGKEETEKMQKAFENAKKRADTNNKLTQGSQSRVQQAAGSDFAPYDTSKNKGGPLSTLVNVGIPAAMEGGSLFLGGAPGLGTLAGAAGIVASKGVGKVYSASKEAIIKKLEDERNLQYSKYALPTQGPDRDKLIQELDAIANKPTRLSTRNKLRMLVAP